VDGITSMNNGIYEAISPLNASLAINGPTLNDTLTKFTAWNVHKHA